MNKRGNGEGSIYQTNDGRWRAAISIGFHGGKPSRKTFTAATRRDVKDKLTRALGDLQRGCPLTPKAPTVGQYFGYWLKNVVTPTTRWKTYRSYEQMVRNHLVKEIPQEQWKAKKLDDVPGLGKVRMSQLSVQRVQEFMANKLGAGNSPALVRYLRVVLRAGLGRAVKEEKLALNVAALASPPQVPKSKLEPFSIEEAKKFLDAASGHRLEPLFTTALAIGLRIGEALGLQWPDVDLDSGAVRVHHQLQRVKKQLVRVEVKSEKAHRIIALPAVCIEALRRHRDRQQGERTFAGTSWRETGYVFTSTIGTPLDDRNVLRQFDKLLSAAGLRKIRVHDLRHTCVSLLAAQGVPIKTISEIIGHSDIRLTQNVYQHVFLSMKREAATAMENILRPVATCVATKTAPEQVN